jgi:hypothetical protein
MKLKKNQVCCITKVIISIIKAISKRLEFYLISLTDFTMIYMPLSNDQDLKLGLEIDSTIIIITQITMSNQIRHYTTFKWALTLHSMSVQ